jgi:hypothetical protein
MYSSKSISGEAVTGSREETHQDLRQDLKPFAGVGVTNRRNEESEAEGQHDDVQHEKLLVARFSQTLRFRKGI